ncbi:hypothetical protein PRZ48_005479 [Zasmidium cellare]|uniref:Cell wall anchored protein n=1 Tax=Zasmidium cellare TaxID=395010 RepID=A0ABR0EUQ0_ZASCE|nr:hypothetical protein PRZ48_005479 [Zasmidium cellare]
MRLALIWLAGFLLLSRDVLAQDQDQDQINNFCRRFAHRSTWIDNKLYVDGGYVDYGAQISSSTVNYTNTQLLWADTTTTTDLSFPPMYDNLTKPANVPSVAGGTLWADEVNKLFYLYGGEYNSTSPPPQQFTLWSFDTIYNTWNTTSTESPPTPNSFGGSAVDQNKGVAYYYGGWKSNATEVGYPGEPQLQSGLVTFDLTTKQWGQGFIDGTPRGEGALFYIPASDQGMLVYFGGVEQSSNATNGTAGTSGVPMDTIWLYDIGSQNTYSQTTSGPTPGMRRRFCGGVSWPEDRSSFDIYLFGGLAPYGEDGFGYADAWILSLPSFTWTILYNSTQNAHHSLSCDVINQGQMIIMGGYFPNSSITDCDAPKVWGMHNLNLGANDFLDVPWYQYQPNLTYYSRPPNLTEVIGGSSTGKPTQNTPVNGFSDPDLGVYMGRLAATGQRTATRALPTSTSSPSATSSPGGGTNVGAIVGGVIGGVAGLLIILAVVFLCLRRKRRARENPSQPAPDNSQMGDMSTGDESTAYGSPNGQNKRDFSGRSWATSLGISSLGGSPESSPQTQQTNWQPVPMHQQTTAQQYYPPPPQAQPFYPMPPAPQQHSAEEYNPAVEMPSVRSPTNVEDVRMASYRNGSSPLARRTGATIHEE